MHRLLVPGLALAVLLFADPILAQDAPTSGRSLASPEQQRQADDAMNTPSGRAGRDEPGAHAPTTRNDPPVLKDGKLNVPAPPKQNETPPGAPDRTIGQEH